MLMNLLHILWYINLIKARGAPRFSPVNWANDLPVAHLRVTKSWAEEMDEIDRKTEKESDSESSKNEELKLVQEESVKSDTDVGELFYISDLVLDSIIYVYYRCRIRWSKIGV